MAFRALWQTANRANARLKATLGGFHGPLTFFIENQSFFHNSFNLYPLGEKIDLADSEKRTPEAKFQPFFRCSKKSLFLKNPHCMAWRAGEFGFVYCREREPRKRAAESHQVKKGRIYRPPPHTRRHRCLLVPFGEQLLLFSEGYLLNP